jgi:predicted acyl esterase
MHRAQSSALKFIASTALAIGISFNASTAVSADTPYDITPQEAQIPMSDGIHLSATLYFPTNRRASEKFPAVFVYQPYRKNDGGSESEVLSYFASRGFVSAQVDIRGTGRSEGHTPNREYSEQEQLDAEQVIAWLAHQAWSNGNVGMWGISWSGFNSLQLAMRNPPGLKAIIAIDATEDLFHEDDRFYDGMMHVDEYELDVDLSTSVTRSPDFPTDEASLTERFDNLPWFITYKQHPRAGAFWDTPVRPLESIHVPAYLIGGMLDGYRDSIPRMLEGIKAPTRALIGPWNHERPHRAVPGPAVEWRELAVQWWNQWLKGGPPMTGPKVSVYMNHWYPPDVNIRTIPGEWRAEAGWPPKGLRWQRYFLAGDHSVSPSPASPARHDLAYHPAQILEAGGPAVWWGDVSPDQRSIDAYSLVYDSAPLSDSLSILGRPRACLQASATAPSAEWFVRVSDVAPDGSTTLVAGKGLNGAHRESSRNPKPLTPNTQYELCFDLHLTSWVFPKEHRIRVSVSNAFWPMIWPTPFPMTTSLGLGGPAGSRIDLPVVPELGPLPAPTFNTPQPDQGHADCVQGRWCSEVAPGLPASSDVPVAAWAVTKDLVHQSAFVEWRGERVGDYSSHHLEHRELMQYRADDLHPELSSVHGETERLVKLKNRTLLWRGTLDARSDRDMFYLEYKRELLENGTLIRSKKWEAAVPRDNQ